MSKAFKKAGEVSLINGGYVSNAEGAPINNAAFVAAQKKAEWLVLLAAKMKGKTFVQGQADSIKDLISEVDAQLSSSQVESFIKMPSKPKRSLAAQLSEEALEFCKHAVDTAQAEKVNLKLQEFSIVNEFETFGLFFKAGVAKLNSIYTMKQITNAAKVVYAVID